MALTPPPAAPQRGDRATFAQRVDAFITWLINFVTELVTLVANLNSIAAGGAYALPYVWGSTGASGSVGGVNGGRIGTDSSAAGQNVAVTLYVDNKDAKGSAVGSMLDSFAASSSTVKGIVRIVKVNDASVFLTMNVTAVAASGNYRYLTVANTGASSASPFANGEAVVLHFQRTGDKGDTGLMGIYPAAKFSDRKTASTSAGDSIAGTQTRTLNTAEYNTIAGASMSGNQITLPAGTYEVSGRVPGYAVNGHKAFFYNVSDGAPAIVGSSASSPNPSGTQTDSVFDGRITITATKVFSIRHYTETAALGSALGRAANGSGQHEVFAEITLTKIA